MALPPVPFSILPPPVRPRPYGAPKPTLRNIGGLWRCRSVSPVLGPYLEAFGGTPKQAWNAWVDRFLLVQQKYLAR